MLHTVNTPVAHCAAVTMLMVVCVCDYCFTVCVYAMTHAAYILRHTTCVCRPCVTVTTRHVTVTVTVTVTVCTHSHTAKMGVRLCAFETMTQTESCTVSQIDSVTVRLCTRWKCTVAV